jgi:hypothetical protein
LEDLTEVVIPVLVQSIQLAEALMVIQVVLAVERNQVV